MTQAAATSSMNQYFDDNEDDFMMRIVHNSCNGVTSCSNGNACQPSIDQLDVWTHCRQPLDFLAFFQPRTDGSVEMMLPMGAYALPKACEYCGAHDTLDCCRDCRRPRLYFARKKPPFAVEPPMGQHDPNPTTSPYSTLGPTTASETNTTSPRSWVIRGLMWH